MANVFPIVRFSDIVQNGNLIQKDISQAFKNLRNILYIDEKQKLNDTVKFLEKLHTNFQDSVELIKNASDDLEETIQELTEYADIYQESGMDDVDEQEKYRMVIENLKIRNEKVLELIGVLRTFNKMHPIVRKLNDKVSDVKKTLEQDFQELNQNLSLVDEANDE
jgi:septal ring factor EnvC (AmiA/AmiB activator)